MNPQNLEKITELRHDLHRHPELAFSGYDTKERLLRFLSANTTLHVEDRGDWLFAHCPAKAPTSRPPIAFRADFDAVPVVDGIDKPYRSVCPGVGHKCGHDGHAAALAGLAMELSALGADRDVYLIFQHAEEVGGGGEPCARLIKEKGIGEVYAFHNRPNLPLGSVAMRDGVICCASKGMIIALTGSPTHASQPELGKNPAEALSKLVLAIPSLIRERGSDGILLGTVVGLIAGEKAFGVAASTGELYLTIRAEDESDLDWLESRLTSLAEKFALEEGLSAEISLTDVFPETRNHTEATGKVRRVCERLGVPVCEMEEPIRSSEDFGYFLKEAPGAMYMIGGGDGPSWHTEAYDFADGILEPAVALFLALIDA